MIVYDLSVPVVDGAGWYGEPDCDPVAVRDVGGLQQCGWLSHSLSLMVLNGTTYLEAGGHLLENGPTLDEVAPDRLLTYAHVVPVEADGKRLLSPSEPLLQFTARLDALLICSGWDRQLEQPGYYHESPYFSPELQDWILAHEPAVLGGDMLSFDDPADETMPFLHRYFEQGGLVLCPLVGLRKLPWERVTLCTAPVKLAGANAAPCRVLAW